MAKKKPPGRPVVAPDWIPSASLAWKIAAAYGILSAVWILVTGHLLHVAIPEPEILEQWEVVKGWFFVVVTAVVLGLALRRYFIRIRDAARSVQASETFANTVLDGLSASVVVVDEQGGIVAFNDVWRRLAVENGLGTERLGLGANYLSVCAAAGGPEAASAAAVAEGIRDVIEGRRPSFELEYPCDSPAEKRWFLARVSPFLAGETRQAIISHENITLRRQQEETLRISEERFRHTFEQAAVGMTHVGLDGRWLRVNQRFCDILGYPREELIQKTWQDLTHPSDIEDDLNFMRQLEEGTIPDYSMEKRYRRKDDSWVWVRLTVSLVRESEALPAYFVSAVEDIQSRREMEAALQMHNTALEDALNGFDIVDEDGRFVYANRAYLRLWGYDRAEGVIGTSPVGHFADPGAWHASTTTLLRNGEDTREFMAKRRDGSTFEALVVAKRFTSPDGRILFMRSSLDITERKKAQEDLRQRLELQDQLAKVAATVPGVIYSFRLRPDGTVCIPFASSALETILGLTPDQLREDASSLFPAIHPEDVTRVRETIAESARTLEPWHAEFRVQHPRLGLRWVEGRSVPQRESDGGVRWHGFVHDVTSRKEADEKLAASETKYRSFYQSTLDGFVTVSLDGRIVETNQVFLDMLGYSAEEIHQKHFSEFTPDRWHQMEEDIVSSQVLTRGHSEIYEKEYRRKDGSIFPIELRAHLIKDQTGEPVGMWAFVRDITARKQSEEELRRQIERYDLVVAGVRDAIWDWDVLRQRVFYSPRWKALRGYAEDEIGNSEGEWKDRIHPDDAPRVLSRLKAHFDGETEVFQEEFRVRCKDGSWKWVLDRGMAQRDAGGWVIRMAGSETDITGRKRVEQDLQASEEKVREFVENTMDLVWAMDENAIFTQMNDASRSMLGRSPKECIGQSLLSFMSTGEMSRVSLHIAEIIAGRGLFRGFEITYLHRDGHPVFLEINGSPQFDPAGRFQGYFGAGRDITARKQAELSLADSEQRYRLLAENSEDFVLLTDATGQRHYVSPSYYRVTGWTAEELQKSDWRERVHPKDLPVVERAHAANLLGEATTIEHRVVCRDGSCRWVEARCKPVLNAAGVVEKMVVWSRDIETRKRAEQRVADALAYNQLLIKSSAIGIVTFRSSGEPIMVNPAITRIIGGTEEQILANNFRQIESWKTSGLFAAAETALRTGESQQIDARFVSRFGRDVCASIQFDRFRFDGSDYLLGMFTDTSEREKAAEALRSSEERFRAYVEQAANALFVHDFSGRFLDVNRQACASLGYTREELLSMNVMDIETDLNFAQAQAVWSGIRPGEPTTVQGHNRRKDGSVFPVEIHFGSFELEGQRVFMGLVSDITERLRIEEELGRERALMRTVIDEIPDAIFVKDIEGRFMLANKGVAQLMGAATPDDLLGRTDGDFFPPEKVAEFRADETKVFAGEPLLNKEEMVLIADDTARHLLTTKLPFRAPDGTLIGLVGIGRDVTERRRAQAALKEKDELLREMSTLARVGGWRFDPATGLGTWTDETARIHDLEPSEMVSATEGLGYFHGAARQTIEAAIGAAISAGTPYDLELEMVTAKGNQKWVRTICHPLMEQGRVVQVRGAIQDITERRQITEALRASEERLKHLVAAAQDAIIMMDPQGHISLWNDAATRMFGYPPDEALGRHLHQLLAPAKFHADFGAAMGNFQKHGTGAAVGRVMEVAALRKDGSGFPAELSLSPALLHGAWHAVGILRDVTERKRMTDDLLESEQRFRDIVLASADWVWEIDAEGRYTFVSENVLDVLGYTPEEILGRTPLELLPPAEAKRLEPFLRELLLQQNSFRELENLNLHKDGTIRHIVSNGVPILGPEGELRGYRGTDKDITERKRAEAKIQEQLEELRRWQDIMLGREDRVQELKREVNDLCRSLGSVARYPSQTGDPADAGTVGTEP